MWKFVTSAALKQQLQQDLKSSLKSKQKLNSTVIRALMNEINSKEKNNENISTYTILSQQIKSRQNSIQEFKKSAREDLAEAELKELEIINAYLPPKVTNDDLKSSLDQIIASKELKKRDFKLIFKELESRGIYAPKQDIVKIVDSLLPK